MPIVRSAGPDDLSRPAPSLSDPEPSASSAPVVPATEAPVNPSNVGAVLALATAGLVETTYLTYVKLFDATVACPTNGCESVLASPWGSLFGAPLPLFGMLAYGAVGAAAALYLRQAADSSAEGVAGRRTSLLALSGGVAALATTSAVLMTILQTRLGGTPCLWCYVSAALSASMAVTLGTSLSGKQVKENAPAAVAAALATAAVLYAGWPHPGAGQVYIDDDFFLEYKSPVVATESSSRAMDLAARLNAVGARMYGAFWCSHCLEQKEEFGGAAMTQFPYVECFPNGWRKGEKLAPLCEAANVRAFPTWVIGGKTIEGELLLDEVEKELARAEAAAAAPEAVAVAP
ncbi:hypothetical protein CHLRE_12g493150v5 [Chlamydomonas reinhardtii]|nr:uncharacterized protein CHLRE_12g493150v5 [Chlamydomonas reinhardtii]PNW74514.1 hypothetical protein CHLRE_12g493150v5 [Chlamydomonas reinhardtii]